MATRGAAARRYAQAILDLAKKAGTLDQWKIDLDALNNMFGSTSTVQALEDPKLTNANETQIIDDLLSRQTVNPMAANLLRLLAQRNRLGLVPRIVEVFGEMYNREKGIVIADVTTAIPLDEAHQKRVSEQLAKITGKTVQIRVHTDPSILGGIITRIGDELIDASVATRLSELAQKLA